MFTGSVGFVLPVLLRATGCVGCVLRFLVCGGYVSKGRVCHMWGCECVLPVMGCLVGVSFLWCMLVGIGARIF